ncbi:hypothetical protein Bca52824_019558 [Brassica carinata]|uniref:Oberon-like PHD finger domain-containing protein n=1 Tax=Brassica carinata TaxID=52824 RepID=A0A8X7VS80_BRACI|nr:hypothetical protein Bca52824_019558 [Brassica carinata]
MFKCRACNHASELIGFVKDVFQHCASNWDRECLVKELDFVSRIFRGSEDQRGRTLFWKCEETNALCYYNATEEIELDSAMSFENGGLIAPQDACTESPVVQETLRKMEVVSEEKMRMFKKARMALEACDRAGRKAKSGLKARGRRKANWRGS